MVLFSGSSVTDTGTHAMVLALMALILFAVSAFMIRFARRKVSKIRLLSVAFYKLKMMLADKLFFAAMIIIPLLITVSAGYALRYEKLNTIPVAMVDEDRSISSSLLMDRLTGKEGIDLVITDREKAEKMLENSQVEQIFIIKPGFAGSIERERAMV